MSKLIFILLLLLLNILGQQNVEDLGKIYDDFNDKYMKDFQNNVIKYLKDNFLYKNEVVIVDKKAFRTIFKEIMSSGGAKAFEVFKNTYNKVCDEVIKDAYPKGVKHIKATELDKYFEYDYIMGKFSEYIKKHKPRVEDL